VNDFFAVLQSIQFQNAALQTKSIGVEAALLCLPVLNSTLFVFLPRLLESAE
jgi:hypothetical protein